MKSRKLAVVFVLMLMGTLMLVGCGQGPAKQATSQAGVVNWTLQTTWSKGWLLHEMAEDFAKRVGDMSGGKFVIKVLPAGAVVGAMENMEATSKGTLDAWHSWTGYWQGKHPSANFFASIPMHLEPTMYVTWMYAGGGKELMQEMYDEMKMNVIVIPGGLTHPELLAMSNKPLRNVADFKGLKYRTPGWWAEILKSMGVSVTMVAGVDLYPSLQKGILDALEFSTPIVNKQQNFHEVTKYVAGPGMHQPTCYFELGFNKDKYNALPAEYKAILQSAAMAMTIQKWSEDITKGVETLEFYKSKGLTLTRVEDADQREFRKNAWKFIDDEVKKINRPHTTKTWASVNKMWKDFSDYEYFMVPVRK
jgi:TRAP-type mannitol/chloroaromatic compound transport system substrate-binding protein